MKHRLILLEEYIKESQPAMTAGQKNRYDAHMESNKEMLKSLGYPDAQLLFVGGESQLYRSGNVTIKLAEDDGSGFIEIDTKLAKLKPDFYANIIKIGEVDGRFYSIKEYLNPLSDKQIKLLKPVISNYWRQKDMVHTDPLIMDLVTTMGEAIKFLDKIGFEADIHMGQLGIDNKGKLKFFDI